jgi:hypothetical protein
MLLMKKLIQCYQFISRVNGNYVRNSRRTFAMPSISDENFEKTIDILIGGVIAMIASLQGCY